MSDHTCPSCSFWRNDLYSKKSDLRRICARLESSSKRGGAQFDKAKQELADTKAKIAEVENHIKEHLAEL